MTEKCYSCRFSRGFNKDLGIYCLKKEDWITSVLTCDYYEPVDIRQLVEDVKNRLVYAKILLRESKTLFTYKCREDCVNTIILNYLRDINQLSREMLDLYVKLEAEKTMKLHMKK